MQKKTPKSFKIAIAIAIIVAINWIGNSVYKRFDLTQDQRYTLSEAALNTVKDVDSPIIVDVFLDGDFPSEFRRLQSETRQLLEEFSVYNPQINFNFINPLEDEDKRDSNIQNLAASGMQPLQLSTNESGKTSQALIFPWALASYNEQTVVIPLIKTKIGATNQELVTNSIQHLEYAFAEGFKKLTTPRSKKIAFLKGNGQLDDIGSDGRMRGRNLEDFILTIREHYNIAPFTLDSVVRNPQRTLNQLKTFDLIIVAKPTEAFTEEEKLVLDQYTMNGGKSLWLTESVVIDKDSLYNDRGSSVSVRRDLNLNDFFFSYGVRVNPVIVADLYSAPIMLAIGEGNNTQFMPIQWPYSPLAASNPEHAITSNLNLVKFDFTSQIDTLKNSVKKTILLKSSKFTKLEGVPKEISLDVVTEEPQPETFTSGEQNLAVLLEGKFNSVYKNRIKPLTLSDIKDESVPTKMIVIADGDVIKNDIGRNGPLDLGFDRSSNQPVGNKEFLQNAVNYLLNDDGLINIRTKEVAIAFLDTQKVEAQKSTWQAVNIALPLVFLGLFGWAFYYFRKRKYT